MDYKQQLKDLDEMRQKIIQEQEAERIREEEARKQQEAVKPVVQRVKGTYNPPEQRQVEMPYAPKPQYVPQAYDEDLKKIKRNMMILMGLAVANLLFSIFFTILAMVG